SSTWVSRFRLTKEKNYILAKGKTLRGRFSSLHPKGKAIGATLHLVTVQAYSFTHESQQSAEVLPADRNLHVVLFSADWCPVTTETQAVLAIPTLADEIREMKEEVEAKMLHPRVIIDAVKFEGATHLPDSIREQLVASFEQREFDVDSNWVGELQEQ